MVTSSPLTSATTSGMASRSGWGPSAAPSEAPADGDALDEASLEASLPASESEESEPPQAERVRTAATERAPRAVRARVLNREVIVEVIAPDGTHPT